MANHQNNAAVGAFVDTGQWRLMLSISKNGMAGMLKNIMQPEEPPVSIFHRGWSAEEDLLEMVKSTVYDNPRMLDDFATQIIITSQRTLWIPTVMTEYEEYDENFFTSFYKADYVDIFTDFDDDQVCLYTLAPGLNSFLSRTLPGCRIASHLSILKNHYKSLAKKGINIFIDLRDGEFDIITFNGEALISAVAHPYTSLFDIEKYVRLLGEAYALNLKEANIHLYGNIADIKNLREMIQYISADVTQESHPENLEANGISHAMILAAEK